MRLKPLALLFVLAILLTACNLPKAATNTPVPAATQTPLPLNATHTPVVPTATHTPEPPTLTPTDPAPIMPLLIDVPFSETSPAPSAYTLNAHYPQLDPASVSQTNPFNADTSSLVMDVVNQMRSDFIANAATLPSDMSGWESYLDVSYDLTHISPTHISLRFVFDFYVAGAAHPNMYYLAYNYNLANHSALALADVFQPGSPYLETMSDYCITELTARLGADVWIGGAGPDLANFKTWNITPDGLLVTFDPYQVASYAAGPQEVTIPYASLGGFFLPQYVP